EVKLWMPQLSVAVGAVQPTTAVHMPGSVFCTMLPGQPAMTGSWLSLTVMLKLHVAVLPLVSWAWYTIVVVPTGKEPPLAGPPSVRMIVAPGQLSFTPGSVQETLAAHWPGAASA